jgi:hypothetical protein
LSRPAPQKTWHFTRLRTTDVRRQVCAHPSCGLAGQRRD